jgi:hypothetical protein
MLPVAECRTEGRPSRSVGERDILPPVQGFSVGNAVINYLDVPNVW